MTSLSTAKRNSDNQRLRHLKRSIQTFLSGKSSVMPTLRKPLRGAEELYRSFGIVPGVDVFVPRVGVADAVNGAARLEFNRKKAKLKREIESEPAAPAGSLADIMKRNLQRNITR